MSHNDLYEWVEYVIWEKDVYKHSVSHNDNFEWVLTIMSECWELLEEYIELTHNVSHNDLYERVKRAERRIYRVSNTGERTLQFSKHNLNHNCIVINVMLSYYKNPFFIGKRKISQKKHIFSNGKNVLKTWMSILGNGNFKLF